MIAKMILPWFGGTSAVWSTCMLFFQLVLLIGYLYAHWLHEMPARRQMAIHCVLLVASLTVLPIRPGDSWKPTGAGNPSFLILGLLAVSIGLPYLILSTTSPLLQAWYMRRSGSVPYRLFALSNLASMIALLSYPFLVEPNLTVRHQSLSWSTGYGVFALLCGLAAWRASGSEPAQVSSAIPSDPGPAPSPGMRLLWTGLAACASTLLLAVTTFLTQDIAAIPFLWVLPLSVYLLSFILSFESNRFYQRDIFMPLLVAALVCFGYFLRPRSLGVAMGPTIALLTASLFICCMVCHGELARLRPHPSRLTGFYVMISIGGAIGGLFVGLLAPAIFNAYYEFPIALTACAALAAFLLIREGMAPVWRFAAVAAVVAYAITVAVITRNTVHGYIAVVRNFYGELKVSDVTNDKPEFDYRKLVHGRINHGLQMHNPQYRRKPVAYFCEAGGIGHAMAARSAGTNWDIGILGLGVGGLIPYGREGDTFHIYEINPQVLDLASSQFTYLKDTPAKVDVTLGDGRLTLERDSARRFDMLVMDAFAGDSVPVHLITREAFEMYLRHLKPNGLLAVNITNRYLDLQPVVERAATALGKKAIVFSYDAEDDDYLCDSTLWAVLMDAASPVPESLKSGEVLKPYSAFRMWTDDFSNMFSILQ